jgi:hypothetical protein
MVEEADIRYAKLNPVYSLSAFRSEKNRIRASETRRYWKT